MNGDQWLVSFGWPQELPWTSDQCWNRILPVSRCRDTSRICAWHAVDPGTICGRVIMTRLAIGSSLSKSCCSLCRKSSLLYAPAPPFQHCPICPIKVKMPWKKTRKKERNCIVPKVDQDKPLHWILCKSVFSIEINPAGCLGVFHMTGTCSSLTKRERNDNVHRIIVTILS